MAPIAEFTSCAFPRADAEGSARSRVVTKRLRLHSAQRQTLVAGHCQRPWRRTLLAAGVRYREPEQLRHTFASTLLSRGVSIKAVADWLGHASPTVTLSTYAHLMPADDDVARGVLDDAFADSADFSRTAEGSRGR